MGLPLKGTNGDLSGSAPSEDGKLNEEVADRIQTEWGFKLRRAPEALVTRLGIVMVILVVLEILLILSNHYGDTSSWEWFNSKSTNYRNAITSTALGRAIHLDSISLDPLSLWRGWAVPSILASSTYILVAALSLRHELFHWKPELLAYYLERCKTSRFGQILPSAWLDSAFHVYEDKHRATMTKNIQRRTHAALEDSKEFFKILRAVALNIFISSIVVLVFWGFMLRTHVDAENMSKLPKSYVPPVQAIFWYLCNDCFYFYPHWIAHHGPTSQASFYRVLPPSIAKPLHVHFNRSHKLHHRTKANLGIAAWYCSPLEQILFNLFPVLIGPYLTQIIADKFEVEDIWGTHLLTLYVWLMAASAMSVLAHTGFRSFLNDPGKHDLHHERAFDSKLAVNFGTMGFFDFLHGTASSIPKEDAMVWRGQSARQAALYEASRRTGLPLTKDQREVVKQPYHGQDWVDKSI